MHDIPRISTNRQYASYTTGDAALSTLEEELRHNRRKEYQLAHTNTTHAPLVMPPPPNLNVVRITEPDQVNSSHQQHALTWEQTQYRLMQAKIRKPVPAPASLRVGQQCTTNVTTRIREDYTREDLATQTSNLRQTAQGSTQNEAAWSEPIAAPLPSTRVAVSEYEEVRRQVHVPVEAISVRDEQVQVALVEEHQVEELRKRRRRHRPRLKEIREVITTTRYREDEVVDEFVEYQERPVCQSGALISQQMSDTNHTTARDEARFDLIPSKYHRQDMQPNNGFASSHHEVYDQQRTTRKFVHETCPQCHEGLGDTRLQLEGTCFLLFEFLLILYRTSKFTNSSCWEIQISR